MHTPYFKDLREKQGSERERDDSTMERLNVELIYTPKSLDCTVRPMAYQFTYNNQALANHTVEILIWLLFWPSITYLKLDILRLSLLLPSLTEYNRILLSRMGMHNILSKAHSPIVIPNHVYIFPKVYLLQIPQRALASPYRFYCQQLTPTNIVELYDVTHMML